MKKIISCIVLGAMIISCLALTGCGKTETTDQVTAPGTHEITTKKYGNYITKYIRGIGKGERQYIAKIDNGRVEAYGYEGMGFQIQFVPKYIYEATYNDVTLTVMINCSYTNYLSSLTTKQTLLDPVYVIVHLDEKGYVKSAELAKLLVDEDGNPIKDKDGNEQVIVDEDAKDGSNSLGTLSYNAKEKIAYFYYHDEIVIDKNNLYCTLVVEPKVSVSSVMNATGSVTYAPRTEPTSGK